MRYFILVKRKGAKTWLGAIPARRGVSLKKLRAIVSKQLKPGFHAKIVSDTQLRRLLRSRVKGAVRRSKGKKRPKKLKLKKRKRRKR